MGEVHESDPAAHCGALPVRLVLVLRNALGGWAHARGYLHWLLLLHLFFLLPRCSLCWQLCLPCQLRLLPCHRPLGFELLFEATPDAAADLTHHVKSAVRPASDICLAAQLLERGRDLILGQEAVAHAEDVGTVALEPPIRRLASVGDARLFDRLGRVAVIERP